MKTLSEYELEVNNLCKTAISYEGLAKDLLLLSNEGNLYATYTLGTFYENGNGVEQNYTTALSHYVLADQLGLPQAKYQMGVTCEFGRCGVTQSYEVALKIYKEAADLGHSDAQCQLGGLYEQGNGVEQNYEIAAHYFKLSSDNGNPRAKFLLADCYMKGLGVSISETEAIKLFQEAAELGNGSSQLVLAVKYKYGHDLPRDYVKAYTYADLASQNARNESDKIAAIELRDEIYSLMSDTDKKSVLT